MSICFVLGTRPEIIKLSPLIRRATTRSLTHAVVHTGQHYDYEMDRVFFEDCELAPPDHQLNTGGAGGTQAQILGNMFTGLEPILEELKPSVVVVEGDTNSVFAGAFVARRLGVAVAHVEAGLRSDDWSMPEEVNRVLTDRLSARLYAPTRLQVGRLVEEGVPEEHILLSGNTIQNAVLENLERASSSGGSEPLSKAETIITLHRPALVDDRERLKAVLSAVSGALVENGLEASLLAHPRTKPMLERIGGEFPAIEILGVLGYLPMLRVLSRAKLLITDSGGLQEEAAILRLPCVTIRENTERPETIESGGNVLTGFDETRIRAAVKRFATETIDWRPLYEVDSPADVIFNDLAERYG